MAEEKIFFRIPKMWTFKHAKKEPISCNAVFQVTNISIKDNEFITCPNCGERLDAKRLIETYSAYVSAMQSLLKNGFQAYPPESQIEAFETHIEGMKRKAADDRKQESS